MPSYRRAQTVAVGDRITSSVFATLPHAFNDRLRFGPDCAWRIAMWDFNLWRQIRNPEGAAFPAQGEFHFIYEHIDPVYSSATWPVTGPGEAEGLNLGNPMAQIVAGSPQIDSEAVRLNDTVPLWLSTGPPVTDEDFWTLGKYQRGAVNTLDGNANTPALSAAYSGLYIDTPYYSPMAKAYGCFLPFPAILGVCGATEDGGSTISSMLIKFSATTTTARYKGTLGTVTTVSGKQVVTYAGSCPAFTDNSTTGHVLTIIRAPWAFYVKVKNGAGYVWDEFRTSEWIEGPYTGGGQIARYDGGQINRAFSNYHAAFKGSNTQRSSETFDIREIAFDNEAFFKRQYLLAPARGVPSGGDIEPIYPRAYFSGSQITAGTFLSFTTLSGGLSHTRLSGYLISGFFAKATNLFESATFDVLDADGNILQSLSLSAGVSSSQLVWLPTASSTATIRIRVTNGARFTGNGTVTIEAAELYDYKPQDVDGYLVKRMTSTGGGTEVGGLVDGDGASYSSAKTIYENYSSKGCIVNTGAAGIQDMEEAINTNAVYEASRRTSRERVKILDRKPFLNVELVGGKTILRFKRWAYGLHNQKADLFYKMAPSFEPETKVVEGETYVVRATTGGISYQGSLYTHGRTFTGVAGVDTFLSAGDAKLYVYDGIKSAARKNGWSNEWVGFINTHTEHPSVSSIWKTDAYADYFTWNDRCAFYAPLAPSSLNAAMNYNYALRVTARSDLTGYDTLNEGERILKPSDDFAVSPELPSGWRYALGFNTVSTNESHTWASSDFCKSCRIYEPPFEVESCVIEPDMVNAGADDVVKITLTGRVHYHESAVSSYGVDPNTWNRAALRAESYRTDDNALREYIVYRDIGTHPSWKTGDAAWDSAVQSLPDNPYGSVIPHFFFVRLIPEPYEDGNDVRDTWDTRVLAETYRQMEAYLKPMSEGFVDGVSTVDYGCAFVIEPFDFAYENLCFQAFGGSSISAFSTSARIDKPNTYGALPNTIIYADGPHNQLAKAVNLLDTFRLMLPLDFQVKSRIIDDYSAKTLQWGSNPCSEAGTDAGFWAGSPPSPGTVTASAYTSASGFSLHSQADFPGSPTVCSGTEFLFYTRKDEADYKFVVSQAAYDYAIPPNVKSLMTGLNIAVIGEVTTSKSTPGANTVSTQAASSPCGTAPFHHPFWDGSTGYFFTTTTETTGPTCVMLKAGHASSGMPPGGVFSIGQVAGGAGLEQCGNGSSADYAFVALSPTGTAMVVVPIV